MSICRNFILGRNLSSLFSNSVYEREPEFNSNLQFIDYSDLKENFEIFLMKSEEYVVSM